jgi:23S rRNA G2069 N7-methylase RlmK/C1962 C5-methylase RlmI
MFYFDKQDPRVLFADIRSEEVTLCDDRKLVVRPDLISDFRRMEFKDETFSLVIFDPPHIKRAGPNSWQAKKYGKLSKEWEDDLRRGFAECFRVLKPGGTLVFKWNEVQIVLSDILKLTDQKPVLGHKTGRQAKTHWVLFVKD